MADFVANVKDVGNESSQVAAASSAVRDLTTGNSSNKSTTNDQSGNSSTQPNIGSQSQPNSSTNSSKKPKNQNRIIKTKKSLNTNKDGKNKPSNTSVINSTFSPMHDINYKNPNKNNPKLNRSKSSSNINDYKDNNKKNILRSNSFTFGDSDSDDSNVGIRTRNGKEVQEAAKNKKPSTTDKISTEKQDSDTEAVVLKEKVKPVPAKLKTIPEPKPWMISRQFNNYLTPQFGETPYKSAPYIKNAVMIYDTIDEAIKTKNVKYPHTKSFAQTTKTRKISDRMKDVFTNIKDKLVKNKNDKLQESKDQAKKDQAETDAKNLVDDLLKINFDDIKADHSLIIELHIKIQQVEGGAKAYITKLENEAMNMKGGKRTRRKRQPVQKGGNNDNGDMEKEKKKKKLKIVNILKQLNSANYIDYEIESIIQELKRLLGPPSTVNTSIPETITTTTTVQEDMYSEPLPVCNKYDENVDNDSKCKENREKLKNRLQYFKKLKELNAMHNDNALVIFAENTFKDAENVIEFNKKTIEAYSKPYAKSDDTTTNKDDKDEQYLATLMPFEPIDKKDSTLDKKITKYNDIVKYLNKNKKHIVNPQLDEKLMTTNTKQTVTQSSSLKNILDVEHILNMIGSFNMGEYQSTYGNANNMGDPGHKKTSDITVVKSTDILRKPENNVNAK